MIHPDRILMAVCHSFCVNPEDIWGPDRQRMISEPRKIAAFLIRKHTLMSLEDIAYYLNRTDHTTCVYWIKQVNKRMNTEMYRAVVDKIEEQLTDEATKATETPFLCDRHPLLQSGSRHLRSWHRLRWLLQRMPGQEIPECGAGQEAG